MRWRVFMSASSHSHRHWGAEQTQETAKGHGEAQLTELVERVKLAKVGSATG